MFVNVRSFWPFHLGVTFYFLFGCLFMSLSLMVHFLKSCGCMYCIYNSILMYFYIRGPPNDQLCWIGYPLHRWWKICFKLLACIFWSIRHNNFCFLWYENSSDKNQYAGSLLYQLYTQLQGSNFGEKIHKTCSSKFLLDQKFVYKTRIKMRRKNKERILQSLMWIKSFV